MKREVQGGALLVEQGEESTHSRECVLISLGSTSEFICQCVLMKTKASEHDVVRACEVCVIGVVSWELEHQRNRLEVCIDLVTVVKTVWRVKEREREKLGRRGADVGP